MKNKNNNPYATNKGGRIACPKGTPKGEPKSTVISGKDLRIKKG